MARFICICVTLAFVMLIDSGAAQAEQEAIPQIFSGVHSLYENKMVDVTDRPVTLTVLETSACLKIALNGEAWCAKLAERWDLTQLAKEQLGDKERCFFDVVEIVEEEGAPRFVKIRLLCD